MERQRLRGIGVRVLKVIDSHTEGEPTRVIVSGGPDLGSGPLSDRLVRFREEADHFRKFAIDEPRAYDAVVGGLLCEPEDSSCAAGVIFFNNEGYLGMCGHGTIGLAVTLYHLGRIDLGIHRIETPVGVVSVDLHSTNRATIKNVPSYRHRKNISVEVDGIGEVTGDIAWGGNWFFLVHPSPKPIEANNLETLLRISKDVREALSKQGHTGANGALIDHIEFSERPGDAEAGEINARNFVLCPGGVHDRSPCGTGTSAKLACLAADGKLQLGEVWTVESITGGRFEAKFETAESDSVIASITGRAWICGETTLVGQAGDPFAVGIETKGSRS
jgi:4-hydroxyproline epimerase